MKNLTLLLTIVLIGTKAFTQNKLNKDTSAYIKHPFFVLNIEGEKKEYIGNICLATIWHTDIASMNIYKEKRMVDSLYPGKGKNGVITVTLKRGTQLIHKAVVLAKFKIPKKYKALPLYVDSSLLTSNIYIFDKSSIKTVKVATDSETGEKYISITSSNSKKKAAKGEFKIRG